MPSDGGDFEASVGEALACAAAPVLGAGKRLAQLEGRCGASTIAPWHLNLMQSLAAELAWSVSRLGSPGSGDGCAVPRLAHAARSSVELRVWAVYRCRSEGNARRFYGDLLPDIRGFHQAMVGIISAVGGPITSDTTGRALHDLETSPDAAKGAWGAGRDRQSFAPVSSAAKEIGLGPCFACMNRAPSKFAHPTSVVVLGFARDASRFTGFFRLLGGVLSAGARRNLQPRGRAPCASASAHRAGRAIRTFGIGGMRGRRTVTGYPTTQAIIPYWAGPDAVFSARPPGGSARGRRTAKWEGGIGPLNLERKLRPRANGAHKADRGEPAYGMRHGDGVPSASVLQAKSRRRPTGVRGAGRDEGEDCLMRSKERGLKRATTFYPRSVG